MAAANGGTMMIERTAILFDLDGTLTDPADGITRSIQHACRLLGVPAPPREELLTAIGPPIQSTLARLIGSNDANAVDAAVAHYRERYAARGMLLENAVYPGIDAMLMQVARSGRRAFVATSKPLVYARRILRHFGLDDHFAGIYGSELDGTRADKTELIAHILRVEHLRPEATVMVGDRKHDVLGARNNGAAAIGVTYGYGSADELREAGADVLCGTVEELEALLCPAY